MCLIIICGTGKRKESIYIIVLSHSTNEYKIKWITLKYFYLRIFSYTVKFQVVLAIMFRVSLLRELFVLKCYLAFNTEFQINI